MPVANAEHAGTKKAARQPNQVASSRADAGGERDAEIAADAVEGERAPARLEASISIAMPTGW